MRKKERERVREINHLSIHQWLRSAIPDSQQPTSPVGVLFLKLPPPPRVIQSRTESYVVNVIICKIMYKLCKYSSVHLCSAPGLPVNMFNQPYVDGSNQPGENLAVVSVDSATHGVLAFWKGNNIHSDLPLELFFVACFSMFLQSLYHFLHHFSIILYPTPCFGCFYSLGSYSTYCSLWFCWLEDKSLFIPPFEGLSCLCCAAGRTKADVVDYSISTGEFFCKHCPCWVSYMTRIDKYDWPLVAYFELLNYFNTFWLEEEVPVLGGGTAAGEIPARGTRVERQQKHTEAYSLAYSQKCARSVPKIREIQRHSESQIDMKAFESIWKHGQIAARSFRRWWGGSDVSCSCHDLWPFASLLGKAHLPGERSWRGIICK